MLYQAILRLYFSIFQPAYILYTIFWTIFDIFLAGIFVTIFLPYFVCIFELYSCIFFASTAQFHAFRPTDEHLVCGLARCACKQALHGSIFRQHPQLPHNVSHMTVNEMRIHQGFFFMGASMSVPQAPQVSFFLFWPF